jgi:hypothetical protein
MRLRKLEQKPPMNAKLLEEFKRDEAILKNIIVLLGYPDYSNGILLACHDGLI